MMRRLVQLKSAVGMLFISMVISSAAQAQVRPPICDVTCSPDPRSSDYSAIYLVRPRIPNQRGSGGPIVANGGPAIAHVQLGSSSFNYAVPLISLPGRSGLNLDLTLYYNSRIWTVASTSAALNADRDFPSYGFRLDFGFVEMASDGSSYVLTEADNSKHLILPNSSGQWVSTDSTFLQWDATNNILTNRGGTQIFYQQSPVTTTLFRPVKIEDPNGNFVSVTYLANKDLAISSITDAVGRQASFQYDASGKLASVTQGSQTFSFSWISLPLNYAFTMRVVNTPASGTAVNLLAGVSLPDGTSVAFDYGNGDWGVIKTIRRLSSSGQTRYSTSYNLPAVSGGALSDAPGFTQQTVFDGVNTATWSYSSNRDATSGITTSTTVTDPGGTVTTTTYSDAGNALDGLALTKSVRDSSGTQLRLMTDTWTFGSVISNPLITAVSTQLETGEISQQQYAYDANGNVIDEKDYDFGNGGPGPLLRETVRTLATAGNGIVDRPASVTVKDGAGNIVGRTDFTYDSIPVVDVTPAGTSVVQHDPAYGVGSSNSRGNVTAITTYTNAAAATGATTQSNTYDILGNVVLVQSSCCRKQWNFSSTTQFAYPDSVVRGPSGNQLTTSATYNFATGQVASTTDENGQVTRYSYDADNRLVSTVQPDGTVVTKSFDDSSALAGATIVSSANSLVQKATFGGLGQALQEQTLNGTSLVGTKQMNYDSLGRLTAQSNVYGPNDTPATTTYQYDALGRASQVLPPGNTTGYTSIYSGHMVTASDPAGKLKRSFADALGRLIRVDEPTVAGAVAGKGSVSFSGTEASVATSNGNGASAGTASATMGGSERSTVIMTHAATHASGTVTINGSEQSVQNCPPPPCRPPMPCCIQKPWWRFSESLATAVAFQCVTVYDSGSVSITVGGFAVTASYGNGSTGSTIASALASALNAGNSPVTASASGSTVSITSKGTGSNQNFALGSSSSTNDATDFGGPSFAGQVSGSTLTGGTDQVNTTVYDTGTVTIKVTANGMAYSKTSNYGQNTTAANIAADLANQINSDTVMNKVVVASASGTVLNLTTVATGANTAYGLSTTSVTTNSNFAAGSSSFTATASGATFTPGQNGIVWDAGTVTVTINGFSTTPYQRTASYSQGSTTTSIASAIVGAFNSDFASPVSASASGSTVTLVAKNQGSDTNYAVSASVATTQGAYFSTPSFAASAVSLTGGQDGTPSLNTPNSTLYSYDALGHLLQVSQGQQTRTYTYDSTGNLLTSKIPETNYSTVTSTYTPSGMILQKADGRGVIASYSYDALNRLSGITYNDGTPGISLVYGGAGASNFGAGRLIATSDGTGSQTYQYNNMGMATQVSRTMSGVAYTLRYTYNSSGQIATITYPSGRVATESYDPIGRLTQVGTGGSMIASIGAYNAAGQILSTTYGNGMQGTFGFNTQGQIASIQYGSSAGSILSLSYNYGPNDDGRILTITDNVTPARSTAYTYDELNRLKIAQTTNLTAPGTWKLVYHYDRYGNRLSQVPVAGTAGMPNSQLLIDPNTNRILSSSFTYDAAGNTIGDGLHAYGFDAENRIKTVDGAANSYGYDWAGMRVKKNGTLYIYSGPKVIAEYASGAAAASPSVEYIYLKEQMAARIAGGSTTYLYGDHLSTRNEADGTGATVRTAGLFPYGDVWYETGVSDKWKFTTYERDAESGLDYAMARYDAPALGRFMSMDSAAASPTDPQTLNRYPYAGDDPINRSDPSGLYPQDQHEFITFLMAIVAQQNGSFPWDPTQLALGAKDADNFYNAATGLLGLGSFLNFEKHFGIPGPIQPCSGENFLQCSHDAGFGVHLWEDNGDDGPHRISGNSDFLGARILNEVLHIVMNLIGKSPDTSGNIAGFRDAWGGDSSHGKGLGQDPNKFPSGMIGFIVDVVDTMGLKIVGMTVETITEFDDGSTMTATTAKLCEDTCDYSNATLVGSTVVDGFTVNIWELPDHYDPLAGFDFNQWFFGELAMGSYSGGFAAGNPFGPNQKMLDCLAAGMPADFCHDVYGGYHPPLPN